MDAVEKAEKRRLVVAAIPAFNASKSIAEIVYTSSKLVDKVVVCDDGSTDLTRMIAKQMGADVIDHGRRMGRGAALRSLFEYAIHAGADVVVTLEGDGQHNPEDIPKVLETLQETGADIVNGSRFLHESSGEIRRKRLTTRILNAAANADVTDASSGFRAYTRKAVELIIPAEMGTSADSEVLMKARSEGLKVIEVPISIENFEPSALNGGRLFPSTDALFGILKRHSIQHPLIIYGVTGFVFFLTGLLVMAYATAHWIFTLQSSPDLLVGGVALLIVGMVTGSTGLILWVMISVVRDH